MEPQYWPELFKRLTAAIPDTVRIYVMEPKSIPEWIMNGLVASCTVVLAVFAGVEIWRAREERRAKTRAADARIGAEAYAVLQRSLRWLSGAPKLAKGSTEE